MPVLLWGGLITVSILEMSKQVLESDLDSVTHLANGKAMIQNGMV